MLFVCLFDLCLFEFVGFLFLLVSGKGYVLWLWHSLDFSLTFGFLKNFLHYMRIFLFRKLIMFRTNNLLLHNSRYADKKAHYVASNLGYIFSKRPFWYKRVNLQTFKVPVAVRDCHQLRAWLSWDGYQSNKTPYRHKHLCQKWHTKRKQDAHRPRLIRLCTKCRTVIKYLQLPCNSLPVLLQ